MPSSGATVRLGWTRRVRGPVGDVQEQAAAAGGAMLGQLALQGAHHVGHAFVETDVEAGERRTGLADDGRAVPQKRLGGGDRGDLVGR